MCAIWLRFSDIMEGTDGARAWLIKSCEVRWMDRMSIPLRSSSRDSWCGGAEGSKGVHGFAAFVWRRGGLVRTLRMILRRKPYCRGYRMCALEGLSCGTEVVVNGKGGL